MKKKDIMKIIFMLVALFLVAGVGLYFYGRLQRKEEVVNVIKVVNSIDKYGYTLNDNASSYYKEEFEVLKGIANDESALEEDAVKQVAKLYVIDLLSLNNKINKYEVTSTQYYYSDKQEMHKQKVIDNFYNIVEDNAYDDRTQKLPEVSNVEIIDCITSSYALGSNKVDSFEVSMQVSYVEDLGYDTKVKAVLVKDKNNYSVVAYEPLLSE